MTYGAFIPEPDVTWPMKEPGSYLDFSYNAAPDLSLGPDTLTSIAVSIKPSGAGELTAVSASFSGAMITVWLGGGVAGRSYVVKIDGTCASGRVFEWTAGIVCDPVLASYPLAAPASADFGTPVTIRRRTA